MTGDSPSGPLLQPTPLGVSLALHIILILSLFAVGHARTSSSGPIQFDIVTNKEEILNPIDMTKRKPGGDRAKGALARTDASRRSVPPGRKFFGVTMDSVVVGEAGPGDVVVPVGDSLMKDPDKSPVPLSDLTEMPSVLKEVKAPYPAEALERGLEGKVVLELLIDTQGRVADARVVRPAGHGFDEAALEAVKRFLFSPARVGGRIVPVRITYTYTFVLG